MATHTTQLVTPLSEAIPAPVQLGAKRPLVTRHLALPAMEVAGALLGWETPALVQIAGATHGAVLAATATNPYLLNSAWHVIP